MAFSKNLQDRERDKFLESPSRPGFAAVEVVGNFTSGTGPFDPPATSNAISRTALGAIETYRYYSGGLAGTLLKTITVTYTNSSLQDLVSVEVS